MDTLQLPDPPEKPKKPDGPNTTMKVLLSLAPIIMALLAGYAYDLGPVVRDVCTALLPFGTVQPLPEPHPIPQQTVDAGAPR